MTATALPGGGGDDGASGGLAGTAAALTSLATQQRSVSGAVLRWSDAAGLETLPAGEYISDLESEVRRLRDTLAAMQRAGEGRNALLDDLKAMEPSNLAELTSRAVRAARLLAHGCRAVPCAHFVECRMSNRPPQPRQQALEQRRANL